MRNFLSIFAALTMCIFLLLSGCSKVGPSGGVESKPVQDEKSAEQKVQDVKTIGEAESVKELQTDSGRFIGQIDSNSVEIQISGTPESKAPKVFRLDDKIKEKITSLGLKKNDPIKFEYYVNEKEQSFITKIEILKQEVSKPSDPKTYTASGIFVGQIDSNSIEVKVTNASAGKGERAFRLSEKIKSTFKDYHLKTGQHIVFEYNMNENNQKVIQRIKSIAAPKPPASNPAKQKEITDTGRYVGQIDANSIEIRISGVPDEKSARAFRLSDKVKEEFQHYGFKEKDVVVFTYYINENKQYVITAIWLLANGEEEERIDSGTYIGQIDANSIEIKISGVPNDLGNRAFRMNDKVKAEFNSYKLKTGMQIRFHYFVDQNLQAVITKIEVIKN